MAVSVTDMLNYWNAIGVFSYVIPFLLIFAVVFAILKKVEILGSNKGVHAIVGASIGLLALQFDVVPIFFANIFPKFGVFLAVVLALLLLMGLAGFKIGEGDKDTWVKWIGLAAGAIVILWALGDFAWFGGPGFSFGYWWYNEYLWSLIVLGIVIGAIVWVTRSE